MSLREKLSVREIARRTGLLRNTITEYLNAGTIEPQFMTPERHSKLDPFADKLLGWLKTEAGKSRKQRRPLVQAPRKLTFCAPLPVTHLVASVCSAITSPSSKPKSDPENWPDTPRSQHQTKHPGGRAHPRCL
tara:strand:- start:9248 stop:9646 length:399 start_codon:yes stop_codon:yes gene_type:complete